MNKLNSLMLQSDKISSSKVLKRCDNEYLYNIEYNHKKSLDHSPTRLNLHSQQIINSQSINAHSIHQCQLQQSQDNSPSQFNLQQYLNEQEEVDEDFFNYVQNGSKQNEKMQVKTQESTKDQNLYGKNQIQCDFGNKTDRVDGNFLNSKGFKANKQPIQIKNMKKWRLKQKQKQVKTFDQAVVQQALSQNNIHQSNGKQEEPKTNRSKSRIKLLSNRQSVHEIDRNINKNEQFQKSHVNLSDKSSQQLKEQAISPRNHLQDNQCFGQFDSEYFSNAISPVHQSNVSIKLIPENNFSDQHEKCQVLKQKLLQKKLSQIDYHDEQRQYFTPKMQSSMPLQLFSRKFSFTEKLTNQILPQLSQNKNQNASQQNTPKNMQEQTLQQSQSDLDMINKNNRSQSMNSKTLRMKSSNTSSLISTSNKGTSTPSLFISQQEYLQNYFNTADTNHYLLSSLTKVVIQPPTQLLQSDSVFIPKVMTRNSSFLKKGANPTESILLFNNTSQNQVKQKEIKQKNNSINQKENIQKPNPSLNFKTNKDVLQFNPYLSSNTPNSQQILNSQCININNNMKSYLFYQNKFLGQKQHEFLMNNFKQPSKISSQILKDQSVMIQQQDIHSQNLIKSTQQKHQQQQFLITTQGFNQNKQNELQQDSIQRDISPKRIICSFMNQTYSNQFYNKCKLNENKGQETIHEQENTSEMINEVEQGTDESTKYDFNNLQKYYDDKYESKILTSNNQNTLHKNHTKNNLKLNNILNNQKNNFIKQKKLYLKENEEGKYNEFQNYQEEEDDEDEREQLKPWNIS